MQLAFELFKKKLNKSEQKPTNEMEVEDIENMGSSLATTHEKKKNEEDYVTELSNDIKLIWLQSALSFIKCDYQIDFKFPTVCLAETAFIEAILNQNYEPDLDSRFSAIYLSLREALTIYKTKYIFVLNTVSKNESTIKLMLEKIPKNNKLKFAKLQAKKEPGNLSEKQLKKHIKVVNHKREIMNAVPMHFIIDCYKQILDFLEDDLRITLKFETMPRNEYEFLMNVKQIVKNREALEDELPTELNTLLERIGTHKDYSFTFIPKKCGQGKYVVIMKVPKGGVRGTYQPKETSSNTPDSDYNCPEQKQNGREAETNSNILFKKIANPIRNASESNNALSSGYYCQEQKKNEKETNKNNILNKIVRPIRSGTESDWSMGQRANSLPSCYVDVKPSSPSVLKKSQCNSLENLNISHWRQPTSAESLPIDSELKVVNQPKAIQFQRGGDFDALDEDFTGQKERKDLERRSWNRYRNVNQMKSKIYEALSVPLKSAKGMRMMQLMGWKGGALGTRGEGITEPIMPAIGITLGAGLGHGSNNFKANVKTTIPATKPLALSISQPDKTEKKPKKSSKKASKRKYKVIEGEQTRLKILSNIREFIMSSQTKLVLTFDEKLEEEDKRFVICSTERFNRRKYVRNLKSQNGADALRRVQEVMLAKPDMFLAAKVSENEKEIVMTKTFKGENNNVIGEDFSMDNDSIQINISVFRYIKTMKPKESYGVYSKPLYQMLGFKLSMMEQILNFLDKKETTLMLYTDISLHEKHTDFLQNLIDVMNMGRKPRYATVEEELLVEKIYNKLGDYCLFLDCFRPLKIIKLQKKNIKKKDSLACVQKNNELKTNDINEIKVQDIVMEKQNNDISNQMISSLECGIKELFEKHSTIIINKLSQVLTESTVKTDPEDHNTQMHKETLIADDLLEIDTNLKDEQNMQINNQVTPKRFQTQLEIQQNPKEGHSTQTYRDTSTINGSSDIEINAVTKDEKNTQLNKEIPITKNSAEYQIQEVIKDNLERNRVVTKSATGEKQIQNIILQDINQEECLKELAEKKIENNHALEENVLNEKVITEAILNPKLDESSSGESSVESEDLLRCIKDLERAILNEEGPLREEHSNYKRFRSNSNNSEQQNVKKIKFSAIKSYKRIHVRPNNPMEKMTTNLAGTVQDLISKAIDDADILPLLECHGIVDDKLRYTCHDESTYSWLKTVICDQFAVVDNEVNLEGRHKMQIKLKTYNYNNTSKILSRIKLYNSHLDVDNWTVHKVVVSIDCTVFEVEVDESDYNFISQCNFSLFAGIDKAKFGVICD